MEQQTIRLVIGLNNTFTSVDGAFGIRGALAVWPDNRGGEPTPIGPIMMRGGGFTRIKAPTETEYAPLAYVAEMTRFRPESNPERKIPALRILGVPVFREGLWSYTDRILIHPAVSLHQLKGCIAPDGWPIEELFEALGGFRFSKQFELRVVV
jgi:hypothetical protein